MRLSKEFHNLLQADSFVNKWRQSKPLCNHSFSMISQFNKCSRLSLATFIILFAIFISPLQTQADDKQPSATGSIKLNHLIENGAYGLTRDGDLIASANLDQPLVPASIIKLLTALVAFDRLGPDYRFKTEFFIDERDNLYIKGYGDPFLISEEIEQIMVSLKKAGCETINDIYLDDSSYQLEKRADGVGDSLNPYDVASSALAVNFNTINVVADKNGNVQSGEPQTPLLPMMIRLGKGLPPGLNRINISEKPADSLLLAGQLFRSFQEKAEISGQGRIARRKAPTGKPFYTHSSSKTLNELIVGLMLYSNNFIANQIFLQIGAVSYGYPATWEKGRKAVREFIDKDPELNPTSVKMVEGSGISRNNRLTLRAMLHILELFKPHAELLPLKNGILLKSGTLDRVYSYAGYLRNNGMLDSFAIILNQGKNKRDEVLKNLLVIYKKGHD